MVWGGGGGEVKSGSETIQTGSRATLGSIAGRGVRDVCRYAVNGWASPAWCLFVYPARPGVDHARWVALAHRAHRFGREGVLWVGAMA